MRTQYGILRQIRTLSTTIADISDAYDRLNDKSPRHMATEAVLNAMHEVASQLKEAVKSLKTCDHRQIYLEWDGLTYLRSSGVEDLP